jgi:hypothetical protein
MRAMVSLDHFKHELSITLRQAHSAGAEDLLVNSTEFVGSIRRGTLNLDTCCQAMNDELQPGDIVEHERDGTIGLTIRYQLPRNAGDIVSDAT